MSASFPSRSAGMARARVPYLSDAKSSPFLLPQEFEGTLGSVVVILGDGLEHGFGKLDMAVFEFTVRVSGRVVDGVDVLF